MDNPDPSGTERCNVVPILRWSSLGASRTQLIGVVMREVSVLVTSGALLGLAFSVWGVQAIRSVFLNLPRVEEVRLDWRALLFTVAASLIATALFGLAPALETLRTDIGGRLYHAARSQGRGRRILQRGLVAGQFAVTLVLLLGSGLLIRSYSKLSRVDPGFDSSHIVTFHVGAEWGEDRPTHRTRPAPRREGRRHDQFSARQRSNVAI